MLLLFDARTSGGLLAALPVEQLERFRDEMARSEQPWWHIGDVLERGGCEIVVTR